MNRNGTCGFSHGATGGVMPLAKWWSTIKEVGLKGITAAKVCQGHTLRKIF